MAKKKNEVYGINVTKALTFILFTLGMGIFLTTTLVVPTIKEFKLKKVENQHALVQYRQVRAIYRERLEAYNRLKEKNRNVIESLQAAFDGESFTKTGKQHFLRFASNASEEEQVRKHFLRQTLTLETTLNDPSHLFSFIEGLNRQTNVLAVRFPFTIRTDEYHRLHATFPVALYRLDASTSPDNVSGEIASAAK